jgi:hypothetical protein
LGHMFQKWSSSTPSLARKGQNDGSEEQSSEIRNQLF